MHNCGPNSQILANAVIGVTVPDTMETTMSETEREAMKKLRTVRRFSSHMIARITKTFPITPRLNQRTRDRGIQGRRKKETGEDKDREMNKIKERKKI